MIPRAGRSGYRHILGLIGIFLEVWKCGEKGKVGQIRGAPKPQDITWWEALDAGSSRLLPVVAAVLFDNGRMVEMATVTWAFIWPNSDCGVSGGDPWVIIKTRQQHNDSACADTIHTIKFCWSKCVARLRLIVTTDTKQCLSLAPMIAHTHRHRQPAIAEWSKAGIKQRYEFSPSSMITPPSPLPPKTTPISLSLPLLLSIEACR